MIKTKVSKTPFEFVKNTTTKQDSVTSMWQGLQQKLDKIKEKVQNDGHTVNFTQVDEFAGTLSALQSTTTAFHATFDTLERLKLGTWIIDTGATTHVCADPEQFIKLSSTPYPILVNLPDGSIKYVTQYGDVNLTSKLALQKAFYVSSLNSISYLLVNFLSLHKLNLFFYPTYYFYRT